MGNRNKGYSGIHVTHVHGFMAALSFVCIVLLFIAILMVNLRFKALHKSMEKFVECQKNTTLLKENSNYMTEQARLFVNSGDLKYLNEYFDRKKWNHERTALDSLKKLFGENDLEFKRIETAFKQSENLIFIEMYAMKLKYESGDYSFGFVPQEIIDAEIMESDKLLSKSEMNQKASSVLFDNGYMLYKQRIDQSCTQLIADITKSLQGDLNGNIDRFNTQMYFMIVLQVVFTISIVAFLLINSFLIISPIKSFLRSIVSDSKFQEKGAYELKLLAKTYNSIYLQKSAKGKRLLKKNFEMDPLTGIMNRKAFDSICSDFVFSGLKTVVLLLIDVDDLKALNEKFGRASGDKALKKIATLLTDNFRETDYIARLGSDEFAVLISDFNGDCEKLLVSKIEKINDAMLSSEENERVSLSAGYVVSDDGFSSEMFDNADKALFKRKCEGKKGITFFSGE